MTAARMSENTESWFSKQLKDMASTAKAKKRKTGRNLRVVNKQEPDNSVATFSGLDPVLGSLGVMIGLLKSTDAKTQSYELVTDWFKNPYENTKDGINKNPKQLGELLGKLLGEVGGNALGVPQSDPALLGTWYPIQIKDSTGEYKPTGLYLVSINNEDGSTAIGLGVLKKWGVPTSQPVVDVEVWGLIPIVLIKKDGSFGVTFAEPKNQNPISIGVAIEGSNGPTDPLIKENGIQFNGVKFSGDLYIGTGSATAGVTVEVLGLQLAGDKKPTNYSLADLEAITGDKILDTAANLFIGALSNRFPDQASSILYFAPLFGLSSTIPNTSFKDVELPLLEWYNMFKVVNEHGDAGLVFINWFNAILANTDFVKGWMTCLGGFLGISTSSLNTSGSGTRNSPYQVPLFLVPSAGQLNFTVASVVVDKGPRLFYPGLSFSGDPVDVGSSEAAFVMEADLELARFELSSEAASADFDLNFKTNYYLKKQNGKQVTD